MKIKIKKFNQFVNETITNYKRVNIDTIKSYLNQAYEIYERDFNKKYPDDVIEHSRVFDNENNNTLYKKDVLSLIKTIFNLSKYEYFADNAKIRVWLELDSNYKLLVHSGTKKLDGSTAKNINKNELIINTDILGSILFNINTDPDLLENINKIFNISFDIKDFNKVYKVGNYIDINDLYDKNEIKKHGGLLIRIYIDFKSIVKTVEYENIIYKNKSTFKEIKGSTEEEIYIKFPWLKTAIFHDAIVGIKNGKLYWLNGHWVSGVWEDGIWKDGIFHDGEWYNGVWNGGEFLKGEWYTGTFNKGKFSALWYDGIFNIKDNDFDSCFEKGIWYDGTFNKGKFENSEWHNGIFNDGFFYKSTWHYGYFKGGKFMESLWKDGIFHNGEFYKSTWMYGLWLKGNWSSGEWHDGVWVNNNGSKIDIANTKMYMASNQFLKFGPKSSNQKWYDGIIVNDPSDREEFQAALDEKDIKYKI